MDDNGTVPQVDRPNQKNLNRQGLAKRAAKEIAKADRTAHVLNRRLQGWSQREIAEEIGVERSRVSQIVSQALAETVREPADEVREMELMRLDKYQKRMDDQIENGKNNEARLAVDRALAILQQRARLLGLEAPQRRVVDVVTDESLERARREVEAEIRKYEAQITDAEVVEYPQIGPDNAAD